MPSCLIVDDNHSRREKTKKIIEQLEFLVIEATTGSVGLVLCKNVMPNAILVDAEMENMSGIVFLQALRRLPGGASPRVFYCTDLNKVPNIAGALHAGANDYFVKPLQKDLVREKFQENGVTD